MTGRNFGWGDKSITTKWNFISKVDSKIYKSLKELRNRYGTLFIFFFSRFVKSLSHYNKSCFCDTMTLCQWHFRKSWSNYGPLGFISISIRKLFKVQNLMADKIACRISLLQSCSSAKWFKEFNAVFKYKGNKVQKIKPKRFKVPYSRKDRIERKMKGS